MRGGDQIGRQLSRSSKVLCREELPLSDILNRKWMMQVPDAKIQQITFSPSRGGGIVFRNNVSPCFGEKGGKDQSFYVVRDDLLHPLVNGNKARKLDGLFPLLLDQAVTDVVTCGGCQSAHAAAVAVSCAERGLRSHLLLRGEQPQILTGYNLISTLYGGVTYIPRSQYAHRESMLMNHADLVAGRSGQVIQCSDILEESMNQTSDCFNLEKGNAHIKAEKYPRKVVIINEGAGDAVALLGVIRLVEYLSQEHILGKERHIKLVVDAGTGTTAIGLSLGVLCLGLPWEVNAIILADTIDAYIQKEKSLISYFRTQFGFHPINHCLNEEDGGLVCWVERPHQRKFGNVLEGEIETCQQIAQQTGILVDPIYTLAAWEMATDISKEETNEGAQVVMLHTGGTLGMFGIAQRYKSYFHVNSDLL